MPHWPKPVSVTAVSVILNWAQRVENTTEYAHWPSLIQVILVSLETFQNTLVKIKSCKNFFLKLAGACFKNKNKTKQKDLTISVLLSYLVEILKYRLS